MKTIVAITGASSGIGLTFARKLAPEHDLFLIARRKDRLDALAQEFSQAYGTQTEVLQADLTDDADLSLAADRIASEQNLALLVNNAGFGTRGYFWDSPLDEQERMHKLHVMASMRLMHAALGNMVAHDMGAIINVASVAAFVRAPGGAGYSATKSWMTAFTEGIHLELKRAGSHVAVQALCPGFTYSEFHDRLSLQRERIASPAFWLTADEVVEASLAGLRDRKLFVVPGWRYKFIVGLMSKLPASVRLAIEASAGRRRKQPLNRPSGNGAGSVSDLE
ncbi:MAG TPA: SDR family oxidoreductase [Bryobacteraceae bacterium]|nr:SDR family oxidoreductase [Bryobacteraceae bacterium]